MENMPLQSTTMPVTRTMRVVTDAHYVNSTNVHVQNTISRALKKLAIQLTLWSVSSVLNVYFCKADRREWLHRTNHSLSQKVHRKIIPLYSDTFCYRIPYYKHLCRQLLFSSLFFNISRLPDFFSLLFIAASDLTIVSNTKNHILILFYVTMDCRVFRTVIFMPSNTKKRINSIN